MILLVLALSCSEPKIINYDIEFDKEIQEHVEYAKAGCIRTYGPGSCLITITRLGYRDYRAICRRGSKK